MKIFDTMGNVVAVLKDGPEEQGSHTTYWDGGNLGGAPVTSGIYYCRFQSNGRSFVEKVIVSR